MKWSEDQARAISLRDQNAIVSAGAGSGKTAVLTERIATLLTQDPGLEMENFLVVTFTDAAANEMRGRIAKRLEELREEAGQHGERAQARRYEHLINTLWQAQISTIHSFCLQMIRRNALSLNISPGVDLLDANEQRVMIRQAARDVVEAALAGPTGDEVQRALVALRLVGREPIIQALVDLCDTARSQVHPEAWLDQAKAMYRLDGTFHDNAFGDWFQTWLCDSLAQALSSMQMAEQEAASVPELAKFHEWANDAIHALQSALQITQTSPCAVDAVADTLRVFDRRAPQIKYNGPEVEIVRACAEKAKKIVRDDITSVLYRGESMLKQDLADLAPHVHVLVDLAKAVLAEIDQRKAQREALDFQDLEHLSYRLLTSSDSLALARVRDQYRHVFVDEYQDTSPIQDALVDLITSGANNLFAVGDVKQSIYRFRMAEPNLFLDRYRRYHQGEGGTCIDLRDNYRSRKEVVAVVNYVFRQLFQEATSGFDYNERVEMRASAPYPPYVEAQAAVEFHIFVPNLNTDIPQESDIEVMDEAEEDTVRLENLEREADWVARQIAQWMQEGAMIYDSKRESPRPLAYRDIAILLRTGKQSLNTVVAALQRHGIPANADTSTGFFGAPEIQWLIAALRAIDNPLDSLSLVALLKSPLIGWDDLMLARVRVVTGGSYWHALSKAADSTEIGDSVRDAALAARDQILRWRTLATRMQVAELVREILDETGYLLYLDGMTRGSVRRANVDKLLDLASSHRSTERSDLFGFLEAWRAWEEADLDFGSALPADADAVSVMTVHHSKGLEFARVFVLNLGRQFNLRHQGPLMLERTTGIGANMYDPATGQRWRTVASIAASYADKRETLAEEARILYVAMTRAKEKLILVGTANELEKKVRESYQAHAPGEPKLSEAWFFAAKSYLDWLVPALVRHPAGAELRALDRSTWDGHLLDAGDAVLSLSIHGSGESRIGAAENHAESPFADMSIDDVEALLTASRHSDTRGPRAIQIRPSQETRVANLYAKVTATDMRRLHAALSGQGKHGLGAATSLLEDPAFVRAQTVSPRERGTAFHAFMQRCAWPCDADPEAVVKERDRLFATGLLDARLAAALQVDDVVQFLRSDLGLRMRQADCVYREQPFFHRIDVHIGHEHTVPVVAQGVIDCLFEEAERWIVIDYKTDRMQSEEDLERLVQEYQAQVATYVAALSPLAREKSIEAYLYFVAAGRAMTVQPMVLSSVFERLQSARGEH
ncbi:UvrD/REP helicase [Alicyclobacillus hesperidum URH17-3-68]|uniref:DNA 3'-5' helicase n=1 Tax=Alicyclobacillus hesperidum TaxID=89784 RepID=A0A1H2Q0Y0_9BACL|nr:helicase-exonuclease AddAB subunit AddA [Alicyclobacillus hesperidum]EJY56345.1 UvrD/REP helicase [Alicyclobacillus hesperidum URH17-3-68]GLV12871.1 ATP-dependent helicase/nuclease subunit A [Alicyclobacillus hesperidum]SDW00700.1 DNA helicase/exodeoxyribonuclease V, subunit A [Alicyclobacillus hesperidum]